MGERSVLSPGVSGFSGTGGWRSCLLGCQMAGVSVLLRWRMTSAGTMSLRSANSGPLRDRMVEWARA
jgi:hypothetical protein